MPGDDEARGAEGVGRPDQRADVAGSIRTVEGQAEKGVRDVHPPEVVRRYFRDGHQLRRLGGLLPQFRDQFRGHRDPLGLPGVQDVRRPAGQGPPGIVDQRVQRPAALDREGDRTDPLDEELAGPLSLVPVGQQRLPLLKRRVPSGNLDAAGHSRRLASIIMDHVLRTERLLLDPVTALDLTALIVHWTQPDVRKFLFDGAVLSIDEIITGIAESRRDFAIAGYGFWVIRELDGDG